MNKKLTEKEKKEVLDSLTIVIDTREKNNKHILKYFDENGIKYISRKLDHADYSYMYYYHEKPYFCDDEIAIERKANIDELIGNIKEEKRFKIELLSLNVKGIRTFLFIENPNYFRDIRIGAYRSEYKPETLISRIKKSIELRHNIPIIPMDKSIIASEIYLTFQSHLYNKLKAGKKIGE